MSRSFFSWLLAIALTGAAGYYSYTNGPSRPLPLNAQLSNYTIEASLPVVHQGTRELAIPVIAPHTSIRGRMLYKILPAEKWTIEALARQGDRLLAFLPKLKDDEKVEYYIELFSGTQSVSFPETGTVLLRYRSDDPFSVLWFHFFFAGVAVLFAFRAGIEGAYYDGQNKNYTLLAFLFFIVGGVGIGMASGEILYSTAWNGIPFGWDATHNLTLALILLWGIATIREWSHPSEVDRPSRNIMVLIAFLATIAFMAVPHTGDSNWRPSERLPSGRLEVLP